MSRAPKEFSNEQVLESMAVSVGYVTHRIAARLGVSTEHMRKKFLSMIELGLVRREREGNNMTAHFRYYVVSDEPACVLDSEFEIARPLQLVRMDGVLTGYGAEMRRHQELSMYARRPA